MNFLSGITNGLREIWAHKFRSLLTLSGVILGVAALIAMVAVVQGMVRNFKVFFEERGGIETITISDDQPPPDQQHMAGISPGRTIKDSDAIAANIPLATYVSPEVNLHWKNFVRNGKTEWAILTGVTPGILPVGLFNVVEGRFISDLDIERAAPVVVLGSQVRDRLYGRNVSPVGQTIRIANRQFTVIGVLEHYELDQSGRNALGYKNRVNFIPVSTAMKRFTGNEKLTGLRVRISDASVLPDIVPQIENTLNMTHRGIRDFQIETAEEQLAEFKRQERAWMISLGGVAAISLLVGGLGIANVMLAVINERIREIGVRKAVGARSVDIFIQFLAESVVLSGLGGILGLIVGVFLVEGLKQMVPSGENIIIPVMAMVAGFCFSVIVGVVSGIYPAFKAASLDPIEALRYE